MLLSPCYKRRRSDKHILCDSFDIQNGKLVHAFSCAYIEILMHLGSLKSTHEARIALGYRLEQLRRTFLSCSPNFPRSSITRYTAR